MLDKRVNTVGGDEKLVFVYFLLTLQLSWLYTTVLHGWRGQTVGKMLLGVRVVRSDTRGQLGWPRAVLRDLPIIVLVACASVVWVYWNVAYFAGQESGEIDQSAEQLFAVIANADILWFLLEVGTMIAHPQRRALHDLIAGSVVIQVEPPPPRTPS